MQPWLVIMSAATSLGTLLGVWWNLHKFGDNIRKEAEWRTNVNNELAKLLENVKTLLESHRN